MHWQRRTFLRWKDRAANLDPDEVQQPCVVYARNEWGNAFREPAPDQFQAISLAAYQRGLPREDVFKIAGILLRDGTLTLMGYSEADLQYQSYPYARLHTFIQEQQRKRLPQHEPEGARSRSERSHPTSADGPLKRIGEANESRVVGIAHLNTIKVHGRRPKEAIRHVHGNRRRQGICHSRTDLIRKDRLRVL